jgi:hypothetical protein
LHNVVQAQVPFVHEDIIVEEIQLLQQVRQGFNLCIGKVADYDL